MRQRAECARLVVGLVAAGSVLAVPAVLPPYALVLVASAMVLAIACLGVNLLFGHTGLLSLGHTAYYGIGAYAGAFLFTFFDVKSLEVYLLSGVVAAALLAAVFGVLCVRATRIHFTILTLGLAQVVHALFISGTAFRPFGKLGQGFFLIGDGGLYIPRLLVGGVELGPEAFLRVIAALIVAFFWVSLGVMERILRSPFGMALHAIRDSEGRATAIGIPVRRYRWRAFVISGAVTGVAGALAGVLDRQVTTEQLYWLFSAELVVAIILGGSRTLLGPVLGAGALVALRELAHGFPVGHHLALGVLLIATIVRFPEGLVPAGAVPGRATTPT